MSTISSFKHIETKYDVYRGKVCMKKFCESLGECAMKIIIFLKKMKLLTKDRWNHMEMQKSVIFLNKKIENKYMKDKKYRKVWDHCHYTGKYIGDAHSICNLKYIVPKKLYRFS